jgi:MFS family permease
MTKKSKIIKWSIWSIAAIFYFYEFVLRVSPSVMVPELMKSFNITAASVGILSAFYLYAYAPLQLPVGILLDHYGVKKVLSFASLICGFGAIIFALSYKFSYASFGRFFIGTGSSFAFVAMVYITSHWFEKNKRAFLIGIANSLAMLGASAGNGPLSSIIKDFGWRQTIGFLGVFGIILGVGVYWIFKIDPKDEKIEKGTSEEESHILKNLKYIVKQKKLWINALVTLLFYTTTTAFGGLWGLSFIETAYSVSKQTAGYAISMIFFGWLTGGPLIGFLSDIIGKRTYIIRIGIIFTLICLIPVIYLPSINIYVVYFLLYLLGLFSSAELLNFSLAIELTTIKAKATAAAFTNMMCSIGDAIIQPLVGFLLDKNWSGSVVEGLRIYSTKDYQLALTVLPICLIIAFILVFFIKEQTKQTN